MPATYKTQRSILRYLALPLAVQANPAENMVAADFTHATLMETGGFAQITSTHESDAKYAGKGHSFTTDSRIIAYDSTMDLSTRVDDFLLGYLLALVLGKDTYTAGVDEAPNSHVLTWLDTSDPAFCINAYVEDTTALKRRFMDLALNELVLTGSEKGSIMAKASFVGSGRWADGALAGGSRPSVVAAPQYIYGSDLTMSIGPTGAPVSMFPRVWSWEATFTRNVDVVRVPGGGLYAAFEANGDPSMKLKMVIGADDSADVRDWAVNQTELEVKIAGASGPATVQLDWPRIKLPISQLTEQNKYVAYTVELGDDNILKPANGEAFTATVGNTYTQYLLPAAS